MIETRRVKNVVISFQTIEKYNFNDNIEIYSDDSYNVDSDEKYSGRSDESDGENSDRMIQVKKIECINLFLEKINGFIRIHPELRENAFREI